MLSFLGNAITALAKRALPILGKTGKGKATATGVLGVATGLLVGQAAPFIGGVLNAENLVPAIRALAEVITALATVVAAFGLGRKAGAGS